MFRFIVIFISLSIVCSTNFLEQDQIPSQDVDDIDLEVVNVELDDKQQRKLQKTPARNMKITYDISYFNRLDLDDEYNQQFRQFCEKVAKTAIQLVNNLLTIVPKPEGYMTMKKKTCGAVTIPEEDRTIDKDSDLHLYLFYSDDENTHINLRICRVLKSLGATHGTIEFGLKHYVSKTLINEPQTFSDAISHFLHYVMRILGLSKDLIDYWVDSNRQAYATTILVQVVRGNPKPLLTTPNVLAFAREYFGCLNLPGMPLEDLDQKKSYLFNWDSTIIQNEFLTGYKPGNTQLFTRFTISALRDTGFYASVNPDFEEEIFYGKDAGCSFVLGECDTTRKEFCTSGREQCDFDGFSVASCSIYKKDKQGCDSFIPIKHQSCLYISNKHRIDQNEQELFDQTGVTFGINSRCFVSDLSPPFVLVETKGRCYQYTCNEANNITIQIGEEQVVCTKNSQVLTVDGLDGTIRCPDSLERYCHSKKLCPNFCSSNGYCLKGVCNCLEGFTGIDCSEPLV